MSAPGHDERRPRLTDRHLYGIEMFALGASAALVFILTVLLMGGDRVC